MLVLALACTPAVIGDPEAAVSPTIATVLMVDFDTNVSASTVVEFGETDAYGYTTPTITGTEHHHVLVGMPSGTEVHWRVVLDGEAGEDHTASTDLLPIEIPELTTVEDDATWEGWLFTTMVGLWQGPVVLNPQGRIVWYYSDTREDTALIRAAPTLDGGGVAYNIDAWKDPGKGEIDRVSWDGLTHTELGVGGQTHDFVEIADGTYASIVIEKEKAEDGELVVGNQLVEVSADGTDVVWNAFDWLDPQTTGTDRAENSWTHANSLQYHPDEGVYRMGLRNLETFVTIDRASGEPLDYFGGEVNDGWVIEDDERPFSYQHNFRWMGDRMILFDNGFDDYDDTRVVEYAVDPTTKTATRTWSYHFDPPRWIYALGDVERLDDESTLISWSIAGRLEQVKDDQTIWRVEAPVGSGFGYLHTAASLYPE